jgi:hypothetical protein
MQLLLVVVEKVDSLVRVDKQETLQDSKELRQLIIPQLLLQTVVVLAVLHQEIQLLVLLVVVVDLVEVVLRMDPEHLDQQLLHQHHPQQLQRLILEVRVFKMLVDRAHQLLIIHSLLVLVVVLAVLEVLEHPSVDPHILVLLVVLENNFQAHSTIQHQV